MNTLLDIDDISIAYSGQTVISNVSFQLAAGDIGCLLGPSGCGKTSLLRAISGFESVHSGSIHLQQKLLCDAQQSLPPEQRNIGLVFQDFALFPHLSVTDNIGFGLHRLPTKQRHQRIAELLELTQLETHAQHFPHQLSGGQQQRVALARAMAPRPQVLLLDEPFSNIDTDLREQLAAEVRSILKSEQITAMLVTHDQMEAFAVADQIAVLGNGGLQQWGTADELYHHPANRFVAEFIGQGAVIPATVLGPRTILTGLAEIELQQRLSHPVNQQINVLVRPEQVIIDSSGDFQAVIAAKRFRGRQYLYALLTSSGQKLLCLSKLEYQLADQVTVKLQLDPMITF